MSDSNMNTEPYMPFDHNPNGETDVMDDPTWGQEPDAVDAEIERQRKAGYETFSDYLTRTGAPNTDESYSAWIGEGRWMITSKDAI